MPFNHWAFPVTAVNMKCKHRSHGILLSPLLFKTCSDERQNGFKGLELNRKFLQPFFNSREHDCFCLKTLKHLLKCLRWFLKINFF